MTAPCYELGIIPCSKAKNAVGVTPLTLYRTTLFSVMVRHAQQRCGRILIMSAKYGLLRPNDRVAHYDSYLPTLGLQQRERLAGEMLIQWWSLHLGEVDPSQVLCYLPKAYFDFMARLVHYQTWAQGLRRPYKSLGVLPLIKVLSNEIKGFESPGLARR